VRTIGNYAFYYLPPVVPAANLNINELWPTLEEIGLYAFARPLDLDTLRIPASVKTIEENAFTCAGDDSGIEHKTKAVVLEGTPDYIGAYAFCLPELTEVTPSLNAIRLGVGVVGSDYVKSLVIGESVTELGDWQFAALPALEELTLPANITGWGKNMFRTGATIPRVNIASVEQWIDINPSAGSNPFAVAGSIYIDGKKLQALDLSEEVTAIPDGMFANLQAVDSVRLHDNIETIGTGAFAGGKFKSLQLGNGVLRIGDKAFENCAKLIHLHIPTSVLTIGKSAFKGCDRLRTLNNGSSLAVIPESAFENCTSLYSVTLGKDVDEIKDYAFAGCTSLTTVTIPDGTLKLGDFAFADNSRLMRIVLGESINSIATNTFKNDTIEELIIKNPEAIAFPTPFAEGMTVYVPEDLVDTYAADPAFAGCEVKALTPLALKLTAPGIATEIGDNPISVASKTELRLLANMIGQEFMGAYANTQPVMTWSSSDENVATVNKNGIVTAQNPGTATITVKTAFNYKEYEQSCQLAVDYDAPTAVIVKAQNPIMALGTTMTLNAEVKPAGALQQVNWSSSNPAIATISAEGTITPVSVGKVTFTATAAANEDIKGSVEIEVFYAMPSGVTITIDKDELRVGDTAQLTAKVDVEFASQAVRWFTGDDKIATVSENGLLTCVGVGKVVISAMTTNDKKIVGTLELNVGYSKPTSLEVESSVVNMKVGDTHQTIFAVEPAGAEQRAAWTVDDEAIATIGEDGKITAKSVGETTITGVAGEHSATFRVIVDYADPVYVYLNYSGIQTGIGQDTQLSAVVKPAGARQEIVWESSDPTIATVDDSGVVTGISKGATSILAKAAADTNVYGGCNVIVVDVSAIDGIETDAVEISSTGGSLILTGLNAGTEVAIFDINGRTVFRAKADAGGSISTPELKSGIYIVRYNAGKVRKIVI
ncbi:MAG: leucine-rich repeat protein, partial [Paramuribaculum sp.]|nr:leucine-rich repeat protein [Paramuribaculum sp.]